MNAPTALPLNPARRPFLRLFFATGTMLASPTVFAGFNFFTSEYTASREELQAQIVRRFPLTQRYGGLLSVSLDTPQLGLDAAANRATLTTTVVITSVLMPGSARQGLLSVSSALRYDATTRAVRLDQPRAEQISLEGLTGRDAERLQRIGAAVAQELLQDQPLHTFAEQELSVGLKTYEIGTITVVDNGIKVQLK